MDNKKYCTLIRRIKKHNNKKLEDLNEMRKKWAEAQDDCIKNRGKCFRFLFGRFFKEIQCV